MIIHGRALEAFREGSRPCARARIRIAGIWKTLANLAETEAAPANIAFVNPPLYRDHSAGTPCRGGDLRPASEPNTVLGREGAAGADAVSLATEPAFRVGDLLRIGSDPWREEVAVIRDLSAGVRLSTPLLFAHPAGTAVQKLDSDWEEQQTALQLKCFRGTSTIFVRDLACLATSAYLRIDDELHRLQVYETESNDSGFYQLPPLQRVGQVELEATAADRRAVVKFQPDFSLRRNQVDLVFRNSETPDSAEENYA